MSSGILGTFYKEAIAAAGGDVNAQNSGSSTLALLAHLLIINSASTITKKGMADQIEELADQINRELILAADIKDAAESKDMVNASIAITMALHALESKDYEGFQVAFDSYMESLGSSREALNTDISNINRSVANVANTIIVRDSDQPLTGMMNIM